MREPALDNLAIMIILWVGALAFLAWEISKEARTRAKQGIAIREWQKRRQHRLSRERK
jgi:hypothetical protein